MEEILMKDEAQDLKLFVSIPPNKLSDLILPLKKYFPFIFAFDSPERLFPLDVSQDSDNRKYICCDANRYMGSTRSPWNNFFHPPIPDPPLPKEHHRYLEERLNYAFSHYANSYYNHEITTSVYCLSRDVGVIICCLIKSPLVEIAYLIDINDKFITSTNYSLSAAYTIKLTEQEFGNKEIDDCCFSLYLRHKRSKEIKISSTNLTESHIRNIGRLIEAQQRHLDILSQWSISSIREVRQIRLHLTDIFNKNISESVKNENESEEGRAVLRGEIDASFQEIKGSLDALEKLASRWKKNTDLRALLPYNLAVSAEQMDIRNDNEYGLKKVDWLVGRNEACRWLKRINYRIEAIQLGLANCGRFLRNSSFAPIPSAMDLKHLSALHMQFSVIDVNSRNPILYIKVGEVMHCLLTFGNLYMENIIVRSLDESHCLPGYISRANRTLFSTTQTPNRRSRAMMELIQDPEMSRQIWPGLLPSLDQLPDNQLPSAKELDLKTPSRFITFVRITEAARNAMVHFSNAAEPSTQMVALREFCDWLATYTRLYQEPCANCGRLLGYDASLPVLRTFSPNPTRAAALHEHCRGSNITTQKDFSMH